MPTSDPPPPRRRWSLRLELHADSFDRLADCADDVAQYLVGSGPTECATTSGGSEHGWHLEVVDDPSMTPERYRAALREWREDREV